ncbi:MAG: DUF502 domain-containing protein [Deltaproteobacteria bacterium]|nr:DUF502 domain-containing protein [Deltaproteobacteria bacterium]
MFRGFWRRLVERLRRDFVAGLLVIVPIGFTILGIYWIVQQLDNLILPKVFAFVGLEPDERPPFVGIFFTVGLILVGGELTRSFVGRSALRIWEGAVDRIPVARSLYAVLKQFMQAVFGPDDPSFSSVVLIEYPRRDVWSYAFLTGEIAGAQVPGAAGAGLPERMVKVFIPSTPNPTTGYFLMLPQDDVKLTDLSVEEAFKLIISAGIATGDMEETQKPETPA